MNFFADLPPQAKAIMAALGLICLIAVGANFIPRGGGGAPVGPVGAGGVSAGYEIIYSNMEPKIAAEAAGELKMKNIPFEIIRDGTAISVPKDRADEARIRMAEKGLPRDGDIGFGELFGNKPNSFISTDFEKKVAYHRALMGELTRVIRKMENIDGAAVIINVPEEQLFAEVKKPTTASVMVKVAANRSLGKEQVEGIQHLVASSVGGLKTTNVTVVAESGKLLSDGMAENAGNFEERAVAAALDRRMKMTREHEMQVENRVQSLLDKLYGPGKSVVRVAVELDFTQKRTMTDIYNAPTDAAGNKIVTNRERVEETTSGSATGGVPGVRANVPGYPLETVGGTNQGHSRTSEKETISELSRQRQLTQDEVGTLKRMSITALIQGLPSERVVTMTEIVASAAGADVAGRGDQVVVRPVAFDTSQTDLLKSLIEQEAKEKEAANPKKKEGGIPLAWIVGIGAAFLVLIMLLAILRLANRKEDTTDVLVNSLGDPGLPPQFDPNALAGYDNMEMSGHVPQAGYEEGPFGFLEQMDPETVAELLSQERAGTAAGVLSLMNPDYGNMVLSIMPEDLQTDILTRLEENQPALPPFQQKTLAQQLKRRLGVPV
ncbi:MAG: flagellar basal-body MS-ring/collar protein FliF [Candidatus Sericytochromatia bacterium]